MWTITGRSTRASRIAIRSRSQGSATITDTEPGGVRSIRDHPEARAAVERIAALAQDTSPVIVAVDGRSGTGKSTLSAWMAAQLGALHIDQDDFYAGGAVDDWRRLSP